MKKLRCALISDIHRGFNPKTHAIHERFFSQLASKDIDVLFVAGDIGHHKQSQVKDALKMIRSFFPNQIIYYVEGNHCLWQSDCYKIRPWRWEDNFELSYFYRQRYIKNRPRPRKFEELISDHNNWCQELGIIRLDGNSHSLSENILVMGFPGWYHETNVFKLQSNDFQYMPECINFKPAIEFLAEKAQSDFKKLMAIPTDNKTVILMTHFPPFPSSYPQKYQNSKPNSENEIDKENLEGADPKFFPMITEKADYLLVGHSHQTCDFMENECRVLNAGCGPSSSGYNDPRFTIFELDR